MSTGAEWTLTEAPRVRESFPTLSKRTRGSTDTTPCSVTAGGVERTSSARGACSSTDGRFGGCYAAAVWAASASRCYSIATACAT